MPEPQSGETLKSFMSRYMSSSESRKTFPDQSQRAAVSYKKFRKARKERKH